MSITRVENLLCGGRSLVGFTGGGEYVASVPELIDESLRALSHLTGHGPIPASTLYQVLGELRGIGHLHPQACARLTRASRNPGTSWTSTTIEATRRSRPPKPSCS